MKQTEVPEDDFDEMVSCGCCGHCFPLDDQTCCMVESRMAKHEHEVIDDMRQALKRLGVCEVRGDVVELDRIPCDHFWGCE